MSELSMVTNRNNQSPLHMSFTGEKVISLSRVKDEGITTSAVLSCASAHVLAQYTGRSDVVFGDTISGTNLVDPPISNTLVGCCATRLPLRVKFDGSGDQTVLHLLQQVKEQQRDRIPHEGLGFRTIIRDYTD
jgi:non-ribosomal peptide synthetase component F